MTLVERGNLADAPTNQFTGNSLSPPRWRNRDGIDPNDISDLIRLLIIGISQPTNHCVLTEHHDDRWKLGIRLISIAKTEFGPFILKQTFHVLPIRTSFVALSEF
ncbi:hypothetical protein AMR75_18690 [Vibrio fluvialis]|nr:hypothetical protein AMR75_18690 [Vibrio fluvialis]